MKLFVLNEVGLSKAEISDFLSFVRFNSMDVYFLQDAQAHISMFEREIFEHVIGGALAGLDVSTNIEIESREFYSIASTLFKDIFIGSFDISNVSNVVHALVRLKTIGLSFSRVYSMYSHYTEFVSSHIFLLKKSDIEAYHDVVNSFHKSITINLYFASRVYGAN